MITGSRLFIYVAAHNGASIEAQIIDIWTVGRVTPHRPLDCRNKMSLRKSKNRLIPPTRYVGLREAPAASPATVHQFAHRRDGIDPKAARAGSSISFRNSRPGRA